MLHQFLGRRVLCLFAALLSVFLLIVSTERASANFNVAEDAFHISNAPGYCFAMAAFAGWYYCNRPDDLPLRKVLNKKGQTQIARQLQEYYARNLISLQAEYCNKNQENRQESFNRFTARLTTGEPRVVLLMNREKSRAVLHAVLAYEWISERNLLKVYDPNYNLQERFIDLEKGQYTSLDITYHAICFPE
jgi:thioredoxin-related protein